MRHTARSAVLLVDDDETLRSTIGRGLERAGYLPRSAADGREALAVASESPPDLVLLDVVMPGGPDGFEVCRQLRALDGMDTVPIVFVTALESESEEAEAFEAGASAFIRKPFQLNHLLTTVREQLGARTSDAEDASPETQVVQWVAPEVFARFKRYLANERKSASVPDEMLARLSGGQAYELARLLNLPEEQVARYIARFLELPFVARVHAQDLALGELPAAFCQRNLVVPVRGPNDETAIVLANPFHWELLETLHDKLWRDTKPRLSVAPPDAIRQLFEDPSERGLNLPSVDDLLSAASTGGDACHEALQIAGEVLRAAVNERASDLHLEPKPRHTLVRLRIDGDMQDVRTIDREVASRIISRFKALAGMDIAERRRPQDGSVEVSVDERRMKLRLATSSTPDGETLVIRLLEPTQPSLPLEKLGMDYSQVAMVSTMANRHQGMLLVVGPTGSGKSTTIFSTLSRVDGQTRSIMSVEDPVEYRIPFANQQQVNEKAGLTFESLLRSAMRQDPDILFLGEIRDQFSAKASLDFASSGHLTVSTMHAANATTSIFRLERLGVERSSMADSLLGIVAQKLIKRLCEVCKEVGPIENEERDILAAFTDDVPETVARPVGCPACRESGYSGRVAVYEVMRFDAVLSERVRAGDSIANIRQFCVDRGDFMIFHHALDKVRQHVCSPHDAHGLVLLEEMRFRQASAARRDLDREQSGEASEGAPAVDPSPSPPEAAARPTTVDGAGGAMASDVAEGPHALVVEDDPVSQRMLAGILEQDGFRVSTAGDGAEALLALGRETFDVVLSDMNMPNLDGMKLLELLVLKGVETPVLLVTSDNTFGVEVDALAAGAADFIRKPVDADTVRSRVRKAIGVEIAKR